jgi:hypothetical protein
MANPNRDFFIQVAACLQRLSTGNFQFCALSFGFLRSMSRGQDKKNSTL